MGCGLWVLGGFLVFVIAEKIFNCNSNEEHKEFKNEPLENNNCAEKKNGLVKPEQNKDNGMVNGECNGVKKRLNGIEHKHSNGYMNGFAKTNGVNPLNGFSKTNGVRPHDLNEVKESKNAYG